MELTVGVSADVQPDLNEGTLESAYTVVPCIPPRRLTPYVVGVTDKLPLIFFCLSYPNIPQNYNWNQLSGFA